MRIRTPSTSTSPEHRRRLSRGSLLVQTGQVHPSDEVAGASVAVVVRLQEPVEGGGVVLGDPLSAGVHESEAVLRLRIVRLGLADEDGVGLDVVPLVPVADDEFGPFHRVHAPVHTCHAGGNRIVI